MVRVRPREVCNDHTAVGPAVPGAGCRALGAGFRDLQDRAAHVLSPSHDLRYYARGALASPALTLVDGAWRHWLHVIKPSLYGTSVVLHSLVDYPVRHFSGRR